MHLQEQMFLCAQKLCNTMQAQNKWKKTKQNSNLLYNEFMKT